MPEWFPHLDPTGQRTFTDLGTPLHDVTFVVVGRRDHGGLAGHVCDHGDRRGEVPGRRMPRHVSRRSSTPGPDPPTITVLTGITEAMVLPAPPQSVTCSPLPRVRRVAGPRPGDRGHNVRFDVAFPRRPRSPPTASTGCGTRGSTPSGWPGALVRDEVPNLRLGTLARHLRASTEPTTARSPTRRPRSRFLHALLERARHARGARPRRTSSHLPTIRAHPSSGKLALHRTAAPHSGRVPLQGPRRTGPLRRQGPPTCGRGSAATSVATTAGRSPKLLREVEAIDVIPCPHPARGRGAARSG